MRDLAPTPPEEPDDGILLAQVNDGFFLLSGERHLDAMLSNAAPYPTPVHCLRFGDDLALRAFLEAHDGPESLWRIHPAIIARLNRKGELSMIDAPSPGEDDDAEDDRDG